MINTIIIEDEANARAGLIKMLAILDPNIHIMAETAFVSEGVKLIDKLKPNIVFLDIELEDGNGFSVLNKVKFKDFKVIFTTAYNQYAVSAFKYSTIDYLLKPIDPLELQATLKKTTEILAVDKNYKEMLSVLNNNLNHEDKKIVVKTSEKAYVFLVKDIINLEADGAYTIFKTVSDKIIVSRNLKYYQSLLGDSFIRCHQSHLVNIEFIKGISKNQFLDLKNNDKVPISKRKITEVNQIIKNL